MQSKFHNSQFPNYRMLQLISITEGLVVLRSDDFDELEWLQPKTHPNPGPTLVFVGGCYNEDLDFLKANPQFTKVITYYMAARVFEYLFANPKNTITVTRYVQPLSGLVRKLKRVRHARIDCKFQNKITQIPDWSEAKTSTHLVSKGLQPHTSPFLFKTKNTLVCDNPLQTLPLGPFKDAIIVTRENAPPQCDRLYAIFEHLVPPAWYRDKRLMSYAYLPHSIQLGRDVHYKLPLYGELILDGPGGSRHPPVHEVVEKRRIQNAKGSMFAVLSAFCPRAGYKSQLRRLSPDLFRLCAEYL